METSTNTLGQSPTLNPPTDALKNPLGRFLYTQNPFYLISCGFILYGLLVAASTFGSQFLRASFLSSSLASYAALMGLTAIAVVRWGKIWDDARTILLVIVIAIVAYSIAVDELCIGNPTQAAMFLVAGALGAFLLSELVLRMCRIRFQFHFRATYYLVLGVFFGSPLLAGMLRASNHGLTSYSPLFFSIAVAAAFLLLIPAVRAGESMTQDNGTPWKWPLYPMSLFVILMVLAGFRSHAIWMSFGSLRGDVVFEPLLLLPLILSLLVLYVEASLRANRTQVLHLIVWFSSALLVCGATSFSDRPQAFDQAIAVYCGSAMTVTMILMASFYGYLWVRRVPGARHALPLCVWGLGVLGKEPQVLSPFGFAPWMILVVGCVLYFILLRLERNTQWAWLAFTFLTGATILMLGNEFGQTRIGMLLGSVWIVLMFLFIGAIFDSLLAHELRRFAGIVLLLGSIVAMLMVFLDGPRPAVGLSSVLIPVLCAGYLVIVKRVAWIYLTAGTLICATLAVGQLASVHFGVNALESRNWPLTAGAVFFCVGVVITSAKTGVYRRKWNDLQRRSNEAIGDTGWGLKPGF